MKSNFVHPHSHLVPLKEIPRAQRVLLYSRYGTPHRDNAEVYKTRPETGSPALYNCRQTSTPSHKSEGP